MSDELVITGLGELDAFLQELPDRLQRNVMRSVVSAAARVFRDEAKAQVPVHLGAILKSIRVSSRIEAGGAIAYVKAGDSVAWYARLVEMGTSAHIIRARRVLALLVGVHFARVAHHPGARPKPFFRTAFESRLQDAIAAAGDKLRERLTAAGLVLPEELEDDDHG